VYTLPTKLSHVNHRSGKGCQPKANVLTTEPCRQPYYLLHGGDGPVSLSQLDLMLLPMRVLFVRLPYRADAQMYVAVVVFDAGLRRWRLFAAMFRVESMRRTVDWRRVCEH